MKMLLLIIPLLIGCTPEVTDVDELYRAYSCDVGIYPPYSSAITNFAPEDSMLVVQFTEGYTGDASYTEEDAVVECEVAYSDSSWGDIDIDGVMGKPLYCQCEKSN